MMVCLWLALACGVGSDERMVRRYAECMTDPNTTLHRLALSGSVGTVALSAEAAEEQLHAQLSRGEVTVAEIRLATPDTANRSRREFVSGTGNSCHCQAAQQQSGTRRPLSTPRPFAACTQGGSLHSAGSDDLTP